MLKLTEQHIFGIHDDLCQAEACDPRVLAPAIVHDVICRANLLLEYNETDDLLDLAAIYTTRIALNRPFASLNVRTGLVAGATFLLLNDIDFVPPKPVLADYTSRLEQLTVREDEWRQLLASYCAPLGKNKRAAMEKSVRKL